MFSPALLVVGFVVASLASVPAAAFVAGTATEITATSWSNLNNSPSGMFFDSTTSIMWILSGVQTNGDHYLYAYTTGAVQRCQVTIPSAAGMSRVDGFYIVGSSAYIVDSQGPIYASTSGRLGGSVYVTDWTNPCGCSAVGTCTSSSATWSPTVTKTLVINALDSSIGDGGGTDSYFRNSGIVVKGDTFYAVNGVHPVNGLTCCYPKSLIAGSLSATTNGGSVTATSKWSFTGSTLGHDVDMEGLTCGPDGCATHIYIGDEYNYVYKLKLGETDPATAVEVQWDLRSIVGSVPDDKGIEALSYDSNTGYFYLGIQQTGAVKVVQLVDPTASTTTTTAAPPTVSSASTTASPITASPITATGTPVTSTPATSVASTTSVLSAAVALVLVLVG